MKIFSKLASRLSGNSNGVLLAGIAWLKLLYSTIFTEADASVDDDTAKARYQELRKSFTDEMRVRWVNYMRTVQMLWGVCAVVITLALLEQAWGTVVQGIIMMLFVWICLGYRIWVLKERRYPPFLQYLRLVTKSPASALPIQTAHLMD